MDLEPGWEKKALIIVGIIFIILVIYAYNPFKSTPNVEIANQTTDTAVATPAPPVVTSDNSTNNTSITNETNGTFQISADVAKNIAAGANSGYTAGQPTQGNVTINNTAFSVWIVPITKASISKKVYVDLSTGTIVGST